MRYLTPAQLDRALPMATAIGALKTVSEAAAAGETASPPRTHLVETVKPPRAELPASVMGDAEVPAEIPAELRAVFVSMAASWVGHGFAVKSASFLPGNPSRDLPAIQGTAMLIDAATGAPRLMVDGGLLTTRRTGALTGLATDILARPESSTFGLIGTGALADDLVAAVLAVRPIERVLLNSRSLHKARALAVQLERDLPDLAVEVFDNAADVAAAADVLTCATTSLLPVVADAAIADGAHINAVGNFSVTGRELASETVARARRFVDTYEGALHEAGELLLTAEEGLIEPGREGIEADLQTMVGGGTGSRPRRCAGNEITLFKSVGTALADLGALLVAANIAEQMDLGVVLL